MPNNINTNNVNQIHPLVSIIIPCYNAEKYLAETLDSVLAQTYTSWECIIVDDHSTDNSLEIIQRYCKNYPGKFTLFTNPRKGACAARNVGFEHSTGDYIQYLDADDLISYNKLEVQLNLISNNQDVLSTCYWGRFFKSIDDYLPENQCSFKNYNSSIELLQDIWLKEEMFANSVWLTPRKLIERAGLWNENLLVNQDGEFFFRVLLHAKKIFFSHKAHVYYRTGANNVVSKSFTEEKLASRLMSYKLYEKILEIDSTQRTKQALSKNYMDFIYRNYPKNMHLTNQAKEYIKSLNVKVKPLTGGKLFKKTANILGFYNTLKLRSLLKK